MSTIGYGDILPTTNYERVYALLIMIIGTCVTALMFGVLANLITESFDDLPTSSQKQNEVRSVGVSANSLRTLWRSCISHTQV
jgi:hypothetical protein